MTVDVYLLPKLLPADRTASRTVVVFDVLRATTTMAAALSTGVAAIRVFSDNDEALAAARVFGAGAITVGEVHALKAPGFDLGNSPGMFTADAYAGRTLFMSTTNGTKALWSAHAGGPGLLLIGALVNRAAVARRVAAAGAPVVLLCSGTDGEVSMEDALGAGAVIDAMRLLVNDVELTNDAAQLADRAFQACRNSLRATLRETIGGHNNRRVGFDADVDFAARLDVFDVVGTVDGHTMTVTA